MLTFRICSVSLPHMLKNRFPGVSLPRPLFRARLAHGYNDPPTAGTSRVPQEPFFSPWQGSC